MAGRHGGRLAEVTRLLPARKGHFLLESGHHGEPWLWPTSIGYLWRRWSGRRTPSGARRSAHCAEPARLIERIAKFRAKETLARAKAKGTGPKERGSGARR
jgi:hypothetical protein